MSFLSPNTFAAAVFGLMRLQKAARETYLAHQMSKASITLTLPRIRSWLEDLPDGQRSDALNRHLGEQMRLLGWLEPQGRAWGSVQVKPDGTLLIAEGAEARFEELKAELAAVQLAQQGADPVAVQDSLVVWNQSEWLNGKGTAPFSLFARHLLDTGLDLLALNPSLAMGGPSIRPLIAAMAPHLARAYDPAQDGKQPGRRLAEVFAETALNTISERPDLISRELRWQRLITGVFVPLQEEVRKGGFQALMTAEGRVRDLFAGEMSRSVLRLLDENSDDYFKGMAAPDRLGGIVLRSTLGELAAASGEGRLVRATFGQVAVDSLVASALKAATDRPELFIRSGADGQPAGRIEWARGLLTEYALALRSAPRPFRPQDGAGEAVVSIALAVTGSHLAERIEGRGAAQPGAELGAALGAFLVRDIFKGFEGAARTGAAPFSRFSPEMGVSLLKLVAEHVARSPQFIVGETPSPQVEGLARMIAETIASDESGLLTAEDWRAVMAAMLQAALENPGTLFGGGEAPDIAKVLALRLLAQAKANFERPADRPGRILFGATLKEALIITLDAASSGILDTFANRGALETHLKGLDLLVRRLNELAVSGNRRLRIGSREWVRIYRCYAGAALEGGEMAILGLTDEDLVQALRFVPGGDITGKGVA